MQKRRQRKQDYEDGDQRSLMPSLVEKQCRHDPENQEEEDVSDSLRTKIMLPYKEAAQCPRSPKDRVWELQSNPQNQDCKQTIHGNREQRKELTRRNSLEKYRNKGQSK